jgi:hypothetical protein
MFPRYFKEVLMAISSPQFYNENVYLPHVDNPVPHEILNNPKWFPFFKDSVGGMDGTHINCHPSKEEHDVAQNCKGGISQNTLALFFFFKKINNL